MSYNCSAFRFFSKFEMEITISVHTKLHGQNLQWVGCGICMHSCAVSCFWEIWYKFCMAQHTRNSSTLMITCSKMNIKVLIITELVLWETDLPKTEFCLFYIMSNSTGRCLVTQYCININDCFFRFNTYIYLHISYVHSCIMHTFWDVSVIYELIFPWEFNLEQGVILNRKMYDNSL
jgi:hypothetical protein